MKDDMISNDQEIWSAIRYLDPDEKRNAANAVGIILIALALVVCIVLVELRLRGL